MGYLTGGSTMAPTAGTPSAPTGGPHTGQQLVHGVWTGVPQSNPPPMQTSPQNPVWTNPGVQSSAATYGTGDYGGYQNAQNAAAGQFAGDLAGVQGGMLQNQLQRSILPDVFAAQNQGSQANEALRNALLGVGDQYANNQIGNINQGTGLQHQLLGNEQEDFMRGIGVQRFGQNSQATGRGAYTSVANNFLNNDFNRQQELGAQRFGIQGQQADNAAQYSINRWMNDLAQNAANRQYGGQIYDASQAAQQGQNAIQMGNLNTGYNSYLAQQAALQAQQAAAQAGVQPGDYGIRPDMIRQGRAQ